MKICTGVFENYIFYNSPNADCLFVFLLKTETGILGEMATINFSGLQRLTLEKNIMKIVRFDLQKTKILCCFLKTATPKFRSIEKFENWKYRQTIHTYQI